MRSKLFGVCMAAFVVLGAQSWAFEFNDGLDGWESGSRLENIENVDGNLVIGIGAETNDPYINGPSGSWDADTITGIEFRIRFSIDPTGYGGTAMYYFPAAGQHGSFGYEIVEPGEWNIVYIDFLGGEQGGDSPMPWEGEIGNVRIDFLDNYPEAYTVEIDWIRFVDDKIKQNNFEYPGLDPWELEGQGSIDSYFESLDEFFSGVASIGVTGIGSDQYHALSQDVEGGLELEKGLQVSVVGAVKIPADSWDADSSLWFRIREFDGTTENLSPVTEVTTFDEWFQFQSSLELAYEPSERTELKVQLYSKNPEGQVFFFDDIFVDVVTPVEPPIENPGWPINAMKLAAGQTIVIDGDVSAEEYEGAEVLIVNRDTVRGVADPYFPELNHNGNLSNENMIETTDLEDFNGTYYFMWDDEYFYAAVSAVDDNYSFVGPDPNGSDTLQFVFAESPSIKPTASMYIPTIAPQGPDGNILAKNDFGGWIETDIMGQCEYAGTVDPDTSDWTVEIKIPWGAMQGGFAAEVFPPQAGDVVGFVMLAIDYDDGELGWFSCNHSSFPWETQGTESLYFIDGDTGVSEWAIY